MGDRQAEKNELALESSLGSILEPPLVFRKICKIENI